jgi:hypothetical protein
MVVGAIAPNAHEGSRSEYLAQYVFAPSALLGWLRLGEPRPIRAGIHAFRIPSMYVTNTKKVDGWAIQGTNKVPDLGPAKEHIKFALLARAIRFDDCS